MKTQNLLNAEINVRRAVFEINKPNRRRYPQEFIKVRPVYVLEQVNEAIKELKIVVNSIKL